MTFDQLCDRIVDYYEENEDEFIDAIEDIDRNNGILGDDRMEDMDTLDEYFWRCTAEEILRRVDLRNFDTDDDYFYNDEDGLVSTNSKDYSYYLDSNFASDLYRYYVSGDLFHDLPRTILKLFETYEEDEDDEDEDEYENNNVSGDDFSNETDKGM